MSQIIGDSITDLEKQPLKFTGRHVWRAPLLPRRDQTVAIRVGGLTGYLEGTMVDQTEADLRFRGLGREPTQRDSSC